MNASGRIEGRHKELDSPSRAPAPIETPGSLPASGQAVPPKTSRTGRLTIQAGDFPLPILVRDFDTEKGLWVIGSRHLDLVPGNYVLSAKLPGCEPSYTLQKVTKGGESVAPFRSPAGGHRPKPERPVPFSLEVIQSRRTRCDRREILAPPWPVACQSGLRGTVPDQHSPGRKRAFASIPGKPARLDASSIVVQEGRTLSAIIPVTSSVTQPAGGLLLKRTHDGLGVAAVLGSEVADYSLKYCKSGDFEEAAQLLHWAQIADCFVASVIRSQSPRPGMPFWE